MNSIFEDVQLAHNHLKRSIASIVIRGNHSEILPYTTRMAEIKKSRTIRYCDYVEPPHFQTLHVAVYVYMTIYKTLHYYLLKLNMIYFIAQQFTSRNIPNKIQPYGHQETCIRKVVAFPN